MKNAVFYVMSLLERQAQATVHFIATAEKVRFVKHVGQGVIVANVRVYNE